MLIRNFELRASRFCAEVMRDGERVRQRQYAFLVGEQTKGGEMLLSLTATDSDVGSDRTLIEYQ